MTDKLVTARATSDDAPSTVHRFIRELADRYATLQGTSASGPAGSAAIDERLYSLELAEAVLRMVESHGRPPQIAVIGPTQTGKSTVVNSIIGCHAADASPLAGFTVHAHGFDLTRGAADAWSESLFPGWQRSQPDKLSRDIFDGYSLSACVPPGADLTDCVVWDTPDFDSLAAQTYRRGVHEIIAVSDVIVLVLSKEKYADLSVWRVLRLIRSLDRPLIIALNKTSDDSRDAIVEALRTRLREVFPAWAGVPIAALSYRTDVEQAGGMLRGPDAETLRGSVCEAIAACRAMSSERRTAAHRDGAIRLVAEHWPAWTAPIEAERMAADAWMAAVSHGVSDALRAYERDYLDHPQRYDSFRLATTELLQLLEIPGVGGVLGQLRQIVTWPARQLWTAGRTWARRDMGPARRAGEEETILQALCDRLLTQLEKDALRYSHDGTAGSAVWRALASRLQNEASPLRERFAAAGRELREQFAPQVRAAATQLFDALREKPLLLNGLRAARATTDAASVLFAVKTAGLHVNDLIFAPAMLAMTSLLTEGALGTYMKTVENDLRRRQRQHARSQFFEGVLARELKALSGRLDDPALFGISPESVRWAEAALRRWEADPNA